MAKSLMSNIATLLVSLGFTEEYNNLSTISHSTYDYQSLSNCVSEFKAYRDASRTVEVSQIRLLSPCSRFLLVLFYGSCTPSPTANSHLRVSSFVFMNTGVGDSTSLHPYSSGGISSFSMSEASPYNSVFNYEILTNGNSFEVFCAKSGTTYGGFALSYNRPVSLTGEALPAVSFFRFIFFLDNFISSNTTNNTSWMALSDSLIGNGELESGGSPLHSTSFPMHTSIVDIETSLFPAIWRNVGAYRLENLYHGRTNYPSNIVSGVILLGSKQYRVIKSDSVGFICYSFD